MTHPAQLPLINAPIVGVDPIDLWQANALLVAWQHKLGPCERPFRDALSGKKTLWLWRYPS